jgi:hypothetical protein
MITVRHIDRLWEERQYARLAATLIETRSDIDASLGLRLRNSTAAAALAVIRLDELGQNAQAICARLVRALIATQQSDGGWGDVSVTVLALRALRCGRGDGDVIARGFQFLATLQKDDGSWPGEPIRRLGGDPATTAFVLLHLGTDRAFADAADIDAALTWLGRHRDELEHSARRHADRATTRCRASFRPTNAARTPSLFGSALSLS